MNWIEHIHCHCHCCECFIHSVIWLNPWLAQMNSQFALLLNRFALQLDCIEVSLILTLKWFYFDFYVIESRFKHISQSIKSLHFNFVIHSLNSIQLYYCNSHPHILFTPSLSLIFPFIWETFSLLFYSILLSPSKSKRNKQQKLDLLWENQTEP